MRHLFECFGNPQAVQRAIDAATPNVDALHDYLGRLERLDGDLTKLNQGRERLLRLIVDGKLTDEQAAKQLEELKEREAQLEKESHRLQEHIDSAPSKQQVEFVAEKLSKWINRRRRNYTNAKVIANIDHANSALNEMTWDEKRALAQMVFSGKRPDGSRMGVDVERPENLRKGTHNMSWKYTIHGHFICDSGMTAWQWDDEELGSAHLQKQLLGMVQGQVTSYPSSWPRQTHRSRGR